MEETSRRQNGRYKQDESGQEATIRDHHESCALSKGYKSCHSEFVFR